MGVIEGLWRGSGGNCLRLVTSPAKRLDSLSLLIPSLSNSMSTTTQVWDTYERIVSETINESKLSLEEEDGQDYGEVLKELRRAWELKLIQSGALALGTEVDPNLQKAGASGSKLGIKLEDGVVPVKKEEETEAKAEATVAREENQSQNQIRIRRRRRETKKKKMVTKKVRR